MKILSRLGELNVSKLWRLAWIGLRNPLLVVPTHTATMRTMDICDRIFGNAHNADKSANAFRHALWNVLIAKRVLRFVRSEEKAILWAEKITTLHETLMPNKPLEREMDLHNNEVGRHFFMELKNSSEEEIILFLNKKAEEAVQVSSVEEAQKFKNVMVCLE